MAPPVRINNAGKRLTASNVLLATTALGAAAALLASDGSDSGHALWRDHLSYFGSPDAPYPTAVRSTFGALGVAIVLWAWARWIAVGRAIGGALVVAGVALIGLGIWSVDCSAIDELCAVQIRGRVVTGSHDVHSFLAVAFFGALGFAGVVATSGRGLAGPGSPAGAGGVASALVIVVGVAWIVGRPFARGSGLVELAVIAASAFLVGMRLRMCVAAKDSKV